jgi:cell division inhibitor SepF
MGVMDKFLNYMKLNDEEEDDDYLDDDYLDDEEDIPAPKKNSRNKNSDVEEDDSDKAPRKAFQTSKVTPIHQASSRRISANGMEVCGIKPSSFEEAREITETLLANRTVILNLEGLDVDVAQRIIDFTAGSCFAISGNLQKISNYVFIITPSSVGVSGDFLDLVENGGFDLPLRG